MEEPTVTNYESVLDADSREEINLKDSGTVIAFQIVGWTDWKITEGEDEILYEAN